MSKRYRPHTRKVNKETRGLDPKGITGTFREFDEMNFYPSTDPESIGIWVKEDEKRAGGVFPLNKVIKAFDRVKNIQLNKQKS